MRAQTVDNIKHAYVFDFDETIVTTDARIHVYRNGVHIKSMTSKEYNFYVKTPQDKLDFSEFNDGELILKAKKHKIWPVLRNVSNAIRDGRSTSEIFILTARNESVKSYIYEFLKRNGIEIQLKHIITIGDDRGIINIADEKRKILTLLTKSYDVIFFDDDPKNIKLALDIPHVKTRLIESLNEKFTQDSDPIDDLEIGMMHHIKRWAEAESSYVYDEEDLLWICAEYGKTEFVKYLLEKGANVHAKNDEALRTASVNGHDKVVELLLDAGADVHARNDYALGWASLNGHVDVVKLLLDAGADVHTSNDYALRWASYNGHVDVVKVLLDAGADVHARNDYALRWASTYGHNKVVKVLKDHIAKERNKIVKENLNEKFTKDSDPISDMGIGLVKIIFDRTQDAYSKKVGMYSNEVWKDVIKWLISQRYSQFDIEMVLRSKLMRWAADHAKGENVALSDFIDYVSQIGNGIKRFLTQEVYPDKEYWLKELGLNEQYTRIGTIPGVGNPTLPGKIDASTLHEQAMGGVSSPGATLANVPGMGNVTPASTTSIGSGDNFGNTIGGKPYTQGKPIKTKKKKRIIKKKKIVKKGLTEKFTDDSDPIKDMGIGLHNLTVFVFNLDSLLDDPFIDFLKQNNITYEMKDKNLRNVKVKFKGSKKSLKKLIDTQFVGVTPEHLYSRIVPESLDEKFEQGTDPIKDMGIGRKLKYDEEVEDWIIKMSGKLPSAMDIYLPEKERVDLFNKVKYYGYKIKTILWDSDEDKWSYMHGSMSKQWEQKHVTKYTDAGWDQFWYEDNYDQGEFILVKAPVEKLKEENVSPYDKIGQSMLKKAKVKSVFKKKKEKGNQNAMVQKKFEHQIITFNDFLNEDKTE